MVAVRSALHSYAHVTTTWPHIVDLYVVFEKSTKDEICSALGGRPCHYRMHPIN